MLDGVSSFTNNVVSKSLDGLALRHNAIASNLANVDTPGYASKTVSFEAQLQSAIQTHRGQQRATASNDAPLTMTGGHARHVDASGTSPVGTLNEVQPGIQESTNTKFRNDENGVDVETEMVSLAQNTQRYIALSNIQSRMLRSTRQVIQNTEG